VTNGETAIDSIETLAFVLEDREDLDGAEPLLRELLIRRQRRAQFRVEQRQLMLELGIEPTDRSSYAEIMAFIVARRLAGLLLARNHEGNVVEASELAERALSGLRAQLGEDAKETLLALQVHGRALAAKGELDGAAEALRTALNGLMQLNGESAMALRCARELEVVLHAQLQAAHPALAPAA
jgi:hypothetical protein